MKPQPPEIAATELGSTAKIFGDRRASLRARDLDDPDQVFDLAAELCTASDRRVMQVSVAELRALADLAVRTAITASQFLYVLERSDANAPKQELLKALRTAAETARAACEARA